MNKPLLGSLVAATLLLGNANAATMFERFEAMELEMKRLQTELADLKAEKAEAPQVRGEDNASEEEDDDDEAEGEEPDEEGEAGEYNEDDADEDDEESIEDMVEELQEEVMELTKATSGNHLKLSVDFRSSYDAVKYDMAGTSSVQMAPSNWIPGAFSGVPTNPASAILPDMSFVSPAGAGPDVPKTHKNNDLLTNRLWLNMNWQANENISFTGQLAYNKTYGARSGNTGQGAPFETFDWFVNENANGDSEVRVKSAYFLYRNDTFAGADIPWTFSIGRRPSTNGHLINMRDDDAAASPTGHSINVEFDGISSKFSLENLTGVEGMYVKLCAGQGATNGNEKFASNGAAYADSADDAVKDIHLAGLIFVPYDDGQYSIGTQFYGASNLPGVDVNQGRHAGAGGVAQVTGQFGETLNVGLGTIQNKLTTVGDIYNGSMFVKVDGIGDEWADFLDDTTFFVSGSMSRTHPDDTKDVFGQQKAMLGSTDMENGYSYWVGTQMPSLISEDGRMGFEFNHGSKYWRPLTYGEDTMVGSKIAVRGNAYEAYFTEPLLDDVLSLQIRYTYLDYDYSGSNGFFGTGAGAPISLDDLADSQSSGNYVKSAQDIRVYLRYRY